MYIYVDRWWGPLDSAWWASWLITRLAGVYDSVELVDLFTDGFIIHQTYVEQADLDPVTFPLLQVVFQLIFQTSEFVCIYIYYIYMYLYIQYNVQPTWQLWRPKIPSSNSGFPRMVFSNGGTLKFHGLLCFIIIFPIFNRASQRVISWVRLPGTPW